MLVDGAGGGRVSVSKYLTQSRTVNAHILWSFFTGVAISRGT